MFSGHFAVRMIELVVDKHEGQAKAKTSRYADHACPLVPWLVAPHDKVVIIDLYALESRNLLMFHHHVAVVNPTSLETSLYQRPIKMAASRLNIV